MMESNQLKKNIGVGIKMNLYSKPQPQLEEDVSDFELNETAKKRIPKNLEELNL